MNDTPAMQQFKAIKRDYPDCILFFRMGDFYETFAEDAVITAKVLDITLTSRDRSETKTPMAGIPYHALMAYLPKMIQAGYKVALCEQVEDPKLAKGIVKREVVRVITPGTVLDAEIQDPKQNTYILSLFFDIKKKKPVYGISYIDVAKGSFFVYESGDESTIINIINNLQPAEVVLSENTIGIDHPLLLQVCKKRAVSYVSPANFSSGYSFLLDYFSLHSLKGFIPDEPMEALKSGGALLAYIQQSQKHAAVNIDRIELLEFSNRMFLDASTIANLELFPVSKDSLSLIDVLDHTQTTMGSRLLRTSLLYPLIQKKDIDERLASTAFFVSSSKGEEARNILSLIHDIERIAGRISYLSPSPQDFLAMSSSLRSYLALCSLFHDEDLALLLTRCLQDSDLQRAAEKIIQDIEKTISEEAGTTLHNGNVIREGVDSELDQLKDILKNGKSWIREFQEQEIKRTGINSLKVQYNKVFGYYIEISNIHRQKVPDDYIRKQTLVNSERYINQSLKDKEDMILGAQDRILVIENALFESFKQHMLIYISSMKRIAGDIALVDMFSTFAADALQYDYIQPELLDDSIALPFCLVQARHPVIEQSMDAINYIPNDVSMDCIHDQILLITGPNMAGKSSILRMCALICLMAQIGSFVPAREAKLCVVDRVFSRVGAWDNLSSGESTFMVEMNETANILHNATKHSFIILDEVGRGTSTYDGVSIAYAVIEYIHEQIGAKTMFATHYHELIDMENIYKRVKNFNVLVKEEKDGIIFLRTLVRGGTDKSYGIHVAKIAGIPQSVIKRANQVLAQYELFRNDMKKEGAPPLISMIQDDEPVASHEYDDYDKLRGLLADIDVNNITPLEGLTLLHTIYTILHND